MDPPNERNTGPETAPPTATGAATEPWVAQRLDLPCHLAGFEAPPCHVHLKFLPLGEEWNVLAMTAAGKLPVLADWMKLYRPAEMHVAPGLAPRMLRARFHPIPAPWGRILSALSVQHLELTPQGSASIFVEDPPERVKRFIHGTQGLVSAVRVRRTLAGQDKPRLTPRQYEILTLAVALGYYELPHKLNLRTIAAKMGISVGAASELLRRGESAIVTSYMDAIIGAHWPQGAESAVGQREAPATDEAAVSAPAEPATWRQQRPASHRPNPDRAIAV